MLHYAAGLLELAALAACYRVRLRAHGQASAIAGGTSRKETELSAASHRSYSPQRSSRPQSSQC